MCLRRSVLPVPSWLTLEPLATGLPAYTVVMALSRGNGELVVGPQVLGAARCEPVLGPKTPRPYGPGAVSLFDPVSPRVESLPPGLAHVERERGDTSSTTAGVCVCVCVFMCVCVFVCLHVCV